MTLSAAQIIQHSDKLFEQQLPVRQLWQTICDHFYPERADFTHTRNVGSEVAGELANSYPVLARRDLANSFQAMLRDGDWFHLGLQGGEPDREGKGWLSWGTSRLRSMMYTRRSGFTKATKEGDHDYAALGQCVISVELNRERNGLLFRNWHMRDCAWFEDETGEVAGVTRKWSAELHQLLQYFGADKLHAKMVERAGKSPFTKADVRHFVMPAEMYDDPEITTQYVSIYIDAENKHIIEVIGINHKHYVVPRFQTIAGSAYAYSPATIIALPDARALQAMTHTLLEAGERYARPPVVATQRAVTNGIDLSPNGVTWLDDEYDQRTGSAITTLGQDRGGWPIGMSMYTDMTTMLGKAFYLDKINLPNVTHQMTAYEVQERMAQYRREALPLFAPAESEYNGQICEQAFAVALSAGLLGSEYDIPQSLNGREVEFKFVSPLSSADDERKTQQFKALGQMLSESAQLKPELLDNVDLDSAFRDAVDGMGSPTDWLRGVENVMQTRQNRAIVEAASVQPQEQ